MLVALSLSSSEVSLCSLRRAAAQLPACSGRGCGCAGPTCSTGFYFGQRTIGRRITGREEVYSAELGQRKVELVI